MNKIEMDILSAIRQRVSTRSYGDRPVAPVLLERLLAWSGKAAHLTDAPPRIALVDGVEQTRNIITYMIGSYGLVQNPPHLLVGILPQESDVARLDLGYVLEQAVLEATLLGLSTCWITGSYDAQQAGNAVGLAAGEIAAAVCALGHPTTGRWGRFHTRTVRRLARGHRRKPLADIAFSGKWGTPWQPDDADPTLTTILEHARLAPSASNRQPWRFIVRPDGVTLALTRTAPIDGGIVMAHLALASAALEREGVWQVRWRDAALARECELPQGVIPVATFWVGCL